MSSIIQAKGIKPARESDLPQPAKSIKAPPDGRSHLAKGIKPVLEVRNQCLTCHSDHGNNEIIQRLLEWSGKQQSACSGQAENSMVLAKGIKPAGKSYEIRCLRLLHESGRKMVRLQLSK